MKRLIKFKFSIFTCILLVISIILIIVSNNELSDYNVLDKIFYIDSYHTWKSLNDISSLIFSALIPLLVMLITLEVNTYINRINNIEAQKINYRNMNKQNSETILREIRQFYEVICYICDLRKIEHNLDIDIFQFDYDEIITEEIRFLERLKEDFFYDEVISNKIQTCINTKDNVTQFIKSSVELYNLFYGFDDHAMKCINRKKIEEDAIKTFYAKSFWGPLYEGQYVKERAVLYLKNNSLMRSNNKKFVNDVIENIIANKSNLDLIHMLGSESDEARKRIQNEEFVKLISVYLGKGIHSVDEMTILSVLDIYQDLYEQEGEYKITCEVIGENNKDDIEFFVKNFNLNRVSDENKINYTTDNFKIHRYI